MSIKRQVQLIQIEFERLKDEVNREYPKGIGLSWVHASRHPQSGTVIANHTSSDDVRLLVRNDKTGKLVHVRYSVYSGWYS